jgi:hypothetical protein
MLAATPEMTVSGGLGDVRLWHLHREAWRDIPRRLSNHIQALAPYLHALVEFTKSNRRSDGKHRNDAD